MKQLAVEWLVEQLTAIGQLQIPKGSNSVTLILNQAKQMEKEQIMKVYFHGWSNGIQGNFVSPEEYYIENFKSE